MTFESVQIPETSTLCPKLSQVTRLNPAINGELRGSVLYTLEMIVRTATPLDASALRLFFLTHSYCSLSLQETPSGPHH